MLFACLVNFTWISSIIYVALLTNPPGLDGLVYWYFYIYIYMLEWATLAPCLNTWWLYTVYVWFIDSFSYRHTNDAYNISFIYRITYLSLIDLDWVYCYSVVFNWTSEIEVFVSPYYIPIWFYIFYDYYVLWGSWFANLYNSFYARFMHSMHA